MHPQQIAGCGIPELSEKIHTERENIPYSQAVARGFLPFGDQRRPSRIVETKLVKQPDQNSGPVSPAPHHGRSYLFPLVLGRGIIVFVPFPCTLAAVLRSVCPRRRGTLRHVTRFVCRLHFVERMVPVNESSNNFRGMMCSWKKVTFLLSRGTSTPRSSSHIAMDGHVDFPGKPIQARSIG